MNANINFIMDHLMCDYVWIIPTNTLSKTGIYIFPYYVYNHKCVTIIIINVYYQLTERTNSWRDGKMSE